MNRLVITLILASIMISACGNSGIDAYPLINPSTLTPKYGDGGYRIRIEPISFRDIPYDLSNSYIAYFAVYEIGQSHQMTFTRIFVGSNYEGKPNVHYFKVYPVEVGSGPVTAFDESARDAILQLCLVISGK